MACDRRLHECRLSSARASGDRTLPMGRFERPGKRGLLRRMGFGGLGLILDLIVSIGWGALCTLLMYRLSTAWDHPVLFGTLCRRICHVRDALDRGPARARAQRHDVVIEFPDGAPGPHAVLRDSGRADDSQRRGCRPTSVVPMFIIGPTEKVVRPTIKVGPTDRWAPQRSRRPERTVERAVTDGFGHVFGAHAFAVGQI